MLNRNIKMGSVLVINVAGQANILCTAWPDTQEILDENSVCIDDTVVCEGSDRIAHPWTELACEVLHFQ
jgi:hypothetical protein